MKKIRISLLLLLSLSILATRTIKSIQLYQNCTGYLKRAAYASTVETAKDELQKSIQYLEDNELTSGYTSIIWRTPNDDIGFWYKNLKSTESELSKVDSTTSSVEKTNLLIKLRETLLDDSKNGNKITTPNGLSRHPYNSLWALLTSISVVILMGLIIRVIYYFELQD